MAKKKNKPSRSWINVIPKDALAIARQIAQTMTEKKFPKRSHIRHPEGGPPLTFPELEPLFSANVVSFMKDVASATLSVDSIGALIKDGAAVIEELSGAYAALEIVKPVSGVFLKTYYIDEWLPWQRKTEKLIAALIVATSFKVKRPQNNSPRRRRESYGRPPRTIT